MAAPADVRLGLLDGAEFRPALLLFQLVELGPQLLHRLVAVLVLGALALALDHSAGGQVRQADGGIRLVHMLAAGATGAVGVHPHLRHVQRYVNVVIEFRGNEDTGKGGVPAPAGVKGGLAHQPVHARLGAQAAKGMVALEVHSGALDAGHLAFGDFHELAVQPLGLAPFEVHPQHHFSPVLGLCAARARLYVQKGVGAVHLAGEHPLEFQVRHLLPQRREVPPCFGKQGVVPLGHRQINDVPGVAQPGSQPLQPQHHRLQRAPLLAQRLGARRVVPDPSIGKGRLHLRQPLLPRGIVKDTPEAPAPARPAPWPPPPKPRSPA